MAGLEKARIQAFKDPQFNEQVEEGEFIVGVNPESYQYAFTAEYEDAQAPGTSASQAQFNRIKPRTLELELLFDKTGAIPDTFEATDTEGRAQERAEGIVQDLDTFRDIMLGYQGELHRPPYCLITWGKLLFKGVLLELKIDFKLFLPDGTPIRATVSTKFQEIVEEEARVREENDQSSDITHERIVKEGDTLHLMTHRIYRDPRYYIQVAQANQLVNFRSLKRSEVLRFPPVTTETNG